MSAVKGAFPNGEVGIYGVNWQEDRETVEDYLADSGLSVPVIMDNPAFASEETPGCYVVPEGGETVTNVLWQKVGEDAIDPPFPLHVIIAPDGTFAYLARNHAPDRVIEVLRRLVEQAK